MRSLVISGLIGKQTRTETLASTDTKALTVYIVIAVPSPRVWYQVWHHSVQVLQTPSLPEALKVYNAAD